MARKRSRARALGERPPHPPASRVLRRVPRLWLPMVLVVAVGILLLHLRDRQRDRLLAWERGASSVRLLSQTTENELGTLRAIALGLAARPELAAVAAGERPDPAFLHELTGLARRHDELDRLELLGADGRLLLRLGRDPSGAVGVSRRGAAPSSLPGDLPLEPGEVAVLAEPAELHPEREPLVFLATPVPAADGAPAGVLVVGRRQAELLAPFVSTSARGAGWCLLMDSKGRLVRLPPNEGGPRPLHDFTTRQPYLWEQMRGLDHGQLLIDTGLFSFQRVAPRRPPPADPVPVTEEPLIVVSFVPTAAIYASSRHTLQRLLLVSAVLCLALLALSWGLARAEVFREEQEEAIRASEGRLWRLSARLLEVQEEERRSLARDLHDDLGQLATAITIDVKSAELAQDPAKRAVFLERAREGARRCLQVVHDLARRLRASVLDDHGIRAALDGLCSEQSERHGLLVRSDVDVDEEALSPAVANAVFRVVQEALTNVARHARARTVEVSVRERGQLVRLEVKDDGRGFSSDEVDPARLGVKGMRERVELLGGEFALESRSGHGTTVRASIPARGPRREGPQR